MCGIKWVYENFYSFEYVAAKYHLHFIEHFYYHILISFDNLVNTFINNYNL